MTQLEQVKQIVGYIDTAYKALIAAAILLVLLIALVHWWQPKPITRSISITFVLVGVAGILGSLLDVLISQALSRLAGESSMLLGLQVKLPQLAADLTAPIRMYGIGFLGAGVVLVVISVLFRTPETRPDVRDT
jgi:membrane glycosyltransferase